MSAVMRPSATTFRPMTEADVDAIFAAEQRIYPFPWTRGNFVDSIRSAYRVWVCEAAGELAGYAVVTLTLDEAQLLNISVLPECRRRGFGVALMDHLMADARHRGAKQLFLEVRPSNAAGLALYARFGFHRIGQRRGYYPAETGREDAIVMARTL